MVKIVYALFFHLMFELKKFQHEYSCYRNKIVRFFCNEYSVHKIGFKTCKKGFILMTHKNLKTEF